jgi:TPR repeat protein
MKKIIIIVMFFCMFSCSYKNLIEQSDAYLVSANNGNIDAMYKLGEMYSTGQGIMQDYKQALYWYKQAGNNGNIDAMYKLGEMYSTGQGIMQDYKQALYWYKKTGDHYGRSSQ